MKKVITYGTYDLLHYGHVRLLERAKALGDYLIVGITADDFDRTRGKINVQQPLSERIEAVRATGLADEIIVEEYEGQKIDDIRRYDVDIFTVGSDWIGYFDYLKEYCEVVYLERTKEVSSTQIREQSHPLSMGIVGNSRYLDKIVKESNYVNGINVKGVYTTRSDKISDTISKLPIVTTDYEDLLGRVDAVYIHGDPRTHYEQAKLALNSGKHVLCESPIALEKEQCCELFELAKEKDLVLMEALKTAYATAYDRLLLLVQAGKIGEVISVEATCTSLSDLERQNAETLPRSWNSMYAWGPTALLPIFQILGTQYLDRKIVTRYIDENERLDAFSKIDFIYDHAVASAKVGIGVKSEGELIISGTEGYIYVPAPWWKTDYFEIRYENPADNRRYFYQLDGEGIRYELVAFTRAVKKGKAFGNISESTSNAIAKIMEEFNKQIDIQRI